MDDEDYEAAVRSPTREMRAYVTVGRDMDIMATADIRSFASLNGTVDESLTEWDALIDGKGGERGVVGFPYSGDLEFRIEFEGMHGCPLSVRTTGDVRGVRAWWRSRAGDVIDTVTGRRDGEMWRLGAPGTATAYILDLEVSSSSFSETPARVTEIVFGDATALTKDIISLDWDEIAPEWLLRWTVNELTMRMMVDVDTECPVARGDVLALAIDVVSPEGTVRVPCSQWLVDDVRRSGGEAVVTAYDGRIVLNRTADGSLLAGSRWSLTDLVTALGWTVHDVVGVDIISEDLATIGEGEVTYADLVHRALLREGACINSYDDGRIVASRMRVPTTIYLEPIPRSMTLDRISEEDSEAADRVTVRWPGGQSVQKDGTGRTIVVDVPVEPDYIEAPYLYLYKSYRLEWTGDPSYWLSREWIAMEKFNIDADVDGLPASSTGSYLMQRVEHHFDGGYGQTLHFYAP